MELLLQHSNKPDMYRYLIAIHHIAASDRSMIWYCRNYWRYRLMFVLTLICESSPHRWLDVGIIGSFRPITLPKNTFHTKCLKFQNVLYAMRLIDGISSYYSRPLCISSNKTIYFHIIVYLLNYCYIRI